MNLAESGDLSDNPHMRKAAIWIRFNRRRPKRKIDRADPRYSATSSSTALLVGRSPWPGCLLLYGNGKSQDEKDCRVLYPYATMFVSDPDDLIDPICTRVTFPRKNNDL
jgi:hypothetical protein